MSNDYAPPEELDAPPGDYQAAIKAVIQCDKSYETVVLFMLTQPAEDDKSNPQSGLGGRIARAWFDLLNPNPRTSRQSQESLRVLLSSAGVTNLNDAIGRVVNISVRRVVMRSDPSRYKSAVVDFRSRHDEPPEFVK